MAEAVANYVLEAVRLYEEWASGGEVGEGWARRLSELLGAPTRRVEAALARYREVFGRLVEERCAPIPGGGEACIYTWARWAFKRYFPVALDAGGTVLLKRGGGVETASYPLHRAMDYGVRGVRPPEGEAAAATPRVDGWQVNLYWDPALARWEFSTRYVLHNMRFQGRRLEVAEYGVRVNPVVQAAWAVAERAGLSRELGGLREGYTLTFMLEHSEPATLLRRTPTPADAGSLRLVLVAAREPGGRLLPPSESCGLAEELGVECLAARSRGLPRSPGEALEWAARGVNAPSVFLWYQGDPEHPPLYEFKSNVYEDYLKAVRLRDARSLAVLLTAPGGALRRLLEEELGADLVSRVAGALEALAAAVGAAAASPSVLEEVLLAAGLPGKLARGAARAAAEGKLERAVRIIAAAALEGFKADEAAEVLEGMARAIREAAGGHGVQG